MSEYMRFSPEQNPDTESVISSMVLDILKNSPDAKFGKKVLLAHQLFRQFSQEQIIDALAKLESLHLIKQTGDSRNPDIQLISKKPDGFTFKKSPQTTTGRLRREIGRFGLHIQPSKRRP